MTHPTHPIFLDEQPRPDGWTLVSGRFLPATARVTGTPYRIAYQNAYNAKGVKSHTLTLGVIIPLQNLPAMEEGLSQRAILRTQKQKWKQPVS
jgi:hypothetical protein